MNCLSYALLKWMTDGGTIKVQASNNLREDLGTSWYNPSHYIPHFLHCDPDGICSEYVPNEVTRVYIRRTKRWWELFNYEGYVKIYANKIHANNSS